MRSGSQLSQYCVSNFKVNNFLGILFTSIQLLVVDIENNNIFIFFFETLIFPLKLVTMVSFDNMILNKTLIFPLKLVTMVSFDNMILNKTLILHLYNYSKYTIFKSFEINRSIQKLKFTCPLTTNIWKTTFLWPNSLAKYDRQWKS